MRMGALANETICVSFQVSTRLEYTRVLPVSCLMVTKVGPWVGWSVKKIVV